MAEKKRRRRGLAMEKTRRSIIDDMKGGREESSMKAK